MKKLLFLIPIFICNFLQAELAPQYQELYKESYRIFGTGAYVEAIQFVTPIIENPEIPKKDLLYFLLARACFYMGRPGQFEDWKTIEKLLRDYPEVQIEYDEIKNPANYLHFITKK